MNEIKHISNTELDGLLSAEHEGVLVGDYMTDSRQETLFVVTDIEEKTDKHDNSYRVYHIKYLNPLTLEPTEHWGHTEDTILEDSIREYYRQLNTADIARTRDLAQRVLNGESFEFRESSENALMDLSSKQTLLALQDSIKEQRAVVESTMKYCKLIHSQMMAEIEEKIRGVEEIRDKMNCEIDKLTYVITTIETYAGIKEEIITLHDGEPASADVPLTVRQAVVFMDEELALLYEGFDWQKEALFDKWLLEDNHFKTLLPEEKSIVAIKPRRREMQYAKDDEFYNYIMNRPNKKTTFLIRNGEKLYRIDSEHIVLEDRMFPNPDEYATQLKKEQEEDYYTSREEGDRDSDRMRKRYTQVAFLLQGLIERSDVFAPHNVQCSFLKMTGIDGKTVVMSYELDTAHQLSDSHPDVRTWIDNLNASLCEGKRIILVTRPRWGNDIAGYEFSKSDFARYYSNEWTQPDFPGWGVYQLHYDKEGIGTAFSDRRKNWFIKYKPGNETYSWTEGWQERKNKVTIYLNIKCNGILNYDDLKMEDLEFYLNCRLYRSQYYEYVMLLKTAKKIMEQELALEDEFEKMMLGEITAQGLEGIDGIRGEKRAIREALDKVKSHLKWKRPISSNEKETYYMVKKTLFSVAFRKKYFKELSF